MRVHGLRSAAAPPAPAAAATSATSRASGADERFQARANESDQAADRTRRAASGKGTVVRARVSNRD